MKKIFLMFFGAIISSLGFAQNNNFKSVSNEEFAKIIAQPNTQLIDVRTASEYSTGHIGQAKNIDIKDASFSTKINSLNPNYPVAVYCRSGARSKIAAKKLAEKGFTVIDLDRGIMNWKGEVRK